jgi:hypothetical protein
MNRRRFVVVSTVLMLVLTAAIAGLSYYSDIVAGAFNAQGMPTSLAYLPADTQAVFGINVKRFVTSSLYAEMMQKHGAQIGSDLSEITMQTGVDPARDIDYVIGAGRAGQSKGSGVVIAVGRFDANAITNFIGAKTKTAPIKLDYAGATVLMVPETNKLEKGIAFLHNGEIALGDLESLHAVLDVSVNGKPGVKTNASIMGMLDKVGSQEMFWFAGDASVLSKIPANTPMVPKLAAIQSVFGTLNMDGNISGKVSVMASDEAAAKQLADLANGLLALGNLASAQNPELADLAKGIHIAQNNTKQLDISITLPIDFLTKLEASKAAHIAK